VSPAAIASNTVASIAPVCPDVLCPDGSRPDPTCRCRPPISVSSAAPRACITLLCPDGSPRDQFCHCPISASSGPAPAPSSSASAVQAAAGAVR
jgi:hypothetical protein